MNILMIILGLGIGGAGAYFLPKNKLSLDFGQDKRRLEQAQEEAKQIREEAKERAESITASMKEAEQHFKETLEGIESLLKEKESLVKDRESRNKNVQNSMNALKEDMEALQKAMDELRSSAKAQLSRASGMSEEDALKQAYAALEDVITEDKEKRMEAELAEFEEDVLRHARAVLQLVIQRLGVQSSVDKNHTSVKVKNDQFKGALIGKGGKNISYLEELLPVSVIFNNGDVDTIYVGGLNLLRRNIAKKAIQKLQKQFRKKPNITHAMIKHAVEEAEKEIMEICDRKGKWACKQMGINPKEVPAQLVNYVGRMYFRTSYGQNIIHHSLEMAFAARMIAELIGTDVDTAMQAAFYHDIGKAIDHDIGGSHDDISKDILEEYGYNEGIVHAAYAHHDKVPCIKPADFIVKAVDAISGGRPGARMESVFNYFERMQQLEAAAKFFEGVQKVFTMSAGREVRVMVNKDQIKDEGMEDLADKIAGKISDDVAFPGIIKVNLIRRSKSVDYAREKARR